MNMLREMITSKNNSKLGLAYEEDEEGRLISARTCDCVPTPPKDTGLHVMSIQYDCRGNTSSSYEIICTDGRCGTNAWPVCEDTEKISKSTENITWTYQDCVDFYVPYMNTTVECG